MLGASSTNYKCNVASRSKWWGWGWGSSLTPLLGVKLQHCHLHVCDSESYKGASSVRWEGARVAAWMCSSRWQRGNLLDLWLLLRNCWLCICPHISNLMAIGQIMAPKDIFILTARTCECAYMAIFWRPDYIKDLEMGRLFWIVWVGLKSNHMCL